MRASQVSRSTAFIVGLRAEAALLSGRVFIGGGDAPGAARAAQAALQSGATTLISFGLAGGLSPVAAPGSLLIPRAVLWRGERYPTDLASTAALGGATCEALFAAESVAVTRAEKAGLHAETRADGVDLESGAVAEAASRAGMPFAVLRAVCDPAWRSLPPAALLALGHDGAIGLGRVLASVARRPGQIGGLLALARDAARARRALQGRLAILHRAGALDAWKTGD